MTTPTQRSKKLMEERGYLVAVVEHYSPYAGRTNDLYGFIDLLGVGIDGTLAVQTTTGAHAAARVRKIQASPSLEYVLAAGWQVLCHGWTKPAKSNKWVCREIQVVSATETGTVSEVAT